VRTISACVWTLVLALAGLRASAQTDRPSARGPGTAAPSAGNCGLDPRLTWPQLRGLISDTYAEVLALQRQLPSSRYAGNPRLRFETKFDPLMAHTGRSAASDAAGNAVVYDEIFVNPSICDIAHGLDEVAYILGHEIAHFDLGHYGALDRWKPPPECGLDIGCISRRQNEFRRCQESQADWTSLAYLRQEQSRYKDGASRTAELYFGHLQDLLWSIGKDGAADPHHAAPAERAFDLENSASAPDCGG
jgi:hypothetical protein